MKEGFELRSVVPIEHKYTLNITEASEYFGIGENKIRSIIANNQQAKFILYIGSHIRIKRKCFESFLDSVDCI